ncbi:hypothetical protein ACET3Z_002327 [Daucus carota]
METTATMASTSNLLSSFPIRPAKFSGTGTGAASLFSPPPSRNSIRKLLFRSSNRSFSNSGSRSSRRLSITCGGVMEIGEAQFSDVVLKSDRPVLVEFVATWCGPCRLISPVIEWAAKEYEEQILVVKIDHDSNPQLIGEYKVYGLPALILFKNGKEIPESRREGAITKAKIKEYLDAFLESVSVP